MHPDHPPRAVRGLRAFAVCTALATLAGCHHMRPPPGPGRLPFLPGDAVDPVQPKVAVYDGVILIDQEVLQFKRPGPVTITWRLVGDTPAAFAADGIRFGDPKAAQEFSCKPGDDARRSYVCTSAGRTRGLFKYDIRLERGQTTLVRDPFVINNWD